MKKILALLCIVSLLCTMTLSATADSLEPADSPRFADVNDAIAILREAVGLPQDVASVATHDFSGNGELDVNDAILVLRGLSEVGERQVVGTMGWERNEFLTYNPITGCFFLVDGSTVASVASYSFAPVHYECCPVTGEKIMVEGEWQRAITVGANGMSYTILLRNAD
jgi:hypothetical protein